VTLPYHRQIILLYLTRTSTLLKTAFALPYLLVLIDQSLNTNVNGVQVEFLFQRPDIGHHGGKRIMVHVPRSNAVGVHDKLVPIVPANLNVCHDTLNRQVLVGQGFRNGS
jgi:hypothetical protein